MSSSLTCRLGMTIGSASPQKRFLVLGRSCARGRTQSLHGSTKRLRVSARMTISVEADGALTSDTGIHPRSRRTLRATTFGRHRRRAGSLSPVARRRQAVARPAKSASGVAGSLPTFRRDRPQQSRSMARRRGCTTWRPSKTDFTKRCAAFSCDSAAKRGACAGRYLFRKEA